MLNIKYQALENALIYKTRKMQARLRRKNKTSHEYLYISKD